MRPTNAAGELGVVLAGPTPAAAVGALRQHLQASDSTKYDAPAVFGLGPIKSQQRVLRSTSATLHATEPSSVGLPCCGCCRGQLVGASQLYGAWRLCSACVAHQLRLGAPSQMRTPVPSVRLLPATTPPPTVRAVAAPPTIDRTRRDSPWTRPSHLRAGLGVLTPPTTPAPARQPASASIVLADHAALGQSFAAHMRCSRAGCQSPMVYTGAVY